MIALQVTRPANWLPLVDRGRTSQIRRAIRWLELVDYAALLLLAASVAATVLHALFGHPALQVAAVVSALGAMPFALLRAVHAPAAREAVLCVLEERSSRPMPAQRPAPEIRRRVHEVLDAAGTMTMVFQPVVNLEDRQVVGYEALARFADGRPPDQWFRDAASIGLGLELELAAVTLALDTAPHAGYLSLNVSPETLTADALFELLQERNRASSIVLEVTEHAVVEDYTDITAAVDRLRALGARLAVDDAGSGISSFQHVLRLRPDIVKLDRWMVDHLDTDLARQALVRFLVAFATEVDLELVAEGIERQDELRTCLLLGVRHGQGYALGRPAPAPRPQTV